MKIFLLALFSIIPLEPILATTPRAVTCTRTEYREEYIPGTKSNPGYVKSFEVDVEIPCNGAQTEKVDNNDCKEGSLLGGILGAGLALSSSRGKDRYWAVPAGGTAGALIGCQVDGG
ncbi:MAG: cAMP phosphodiesterase [Prochlorococcus sp. SP3034]|nr:cAMP phosphodiesterase [Prochlorococcus sp. SP3034]|tara:strand:- start:100 stop:450 length:351 start_codon:yes stop_codon:yes gene_type:complete